jgi:glycosyltransferase involved in cell wall biosynthesis
VTLVAQGRPLSADQRAELARAPGLSVVEDPGRLEWMEAPWDDVARSGERLVALAARLRPDVVHLNGYAHAALPLGAPTVVVAHSCVSSWFEAVRGGPPPPSFDRYRTEVRRGLAAADLVIAPTRAMLRALERHHGPARRAEVIPNGRDPARFPPGPKAPFVLCAARLWDEAKGALTLDAAAAHVRWPVFLAGEDASPDPARRERTPPRHAHSLGRLTPGALARVLAQAALYALPARYEPFGLSALEAALAGCALVLGDVPSLRETWRGAAAFVTPGDPAMLAAAIDRLAGDGPLRAELSRRARARALRLGPDEMAERYLAAYARAAAARATAEGVPCVS